MPLATLSVRIDDANPLHHLWNNNGTWWVHYTLNFDVRTRRRRRSLGTNSVQEAVRRRDELFERVLREGEVVAERGRRPEALSSTVEAAAVAIGTTWWTISELRDTACRAG